VGGLKKPQGFFRRRTKRALQRTAVGSIGANNFRGLFWNLEKSSKRKSATKFRTAYSRACLNGTRE